MLTGPLPKPAHTLAWILAILALAIAVRTAAIAWTDTTLRARPHQPADPAWREAHRRYLQPHHVWLLPDEIDYLSLTARLRFGPAFQNDWPSFATDRLPLPAATTAAIDQLATAAGLIPQNPSIHQRTPRLLRLWQAGQIALTCLALIALLGLLPAALVHPPHTTSSPPARSKPRRFARPSPHAVALIAAAILAIDPLFTAATTLALADAHQTALLAILIVALAAPSPGAGRIALACTAAAAMVYVRPDALAYILALCLARSLAAPRAHRRLRAALLAPAAIAAVAHVPWVLHNAALPDGRHRMTSLGGLTLYDGIAAHATGASNQAGLRQSAAAAGARNAWQLDDHYLARSVSTILQEPGRILALAPAKIRATFAPATRGTFTSPAADHLLAAWSIALYAFAVAGVLCLLLRPNPALLLTLLAPIAALAILHAIVPGSIRYRVIISPSLAILAAVAIAQAGRSLLTRRSVSPAAPQSDPSDGSTQSSAPPSP